MCTFSKTLEVALQSLPNKGMRVFFYSDNPIIMARTQKWAMFDTSHLILHRLVFQLEEEQPSSSTENRLFRDCSVETQMTGPPSHGGEATPKGSCKGNECNADIEAPGHSSSTGFLGATAYVSSVKMVC